MKRRSDNSLKYLLFFTNFLFLLYYIILAVYTRTHYDDLHFLWKLREMSIVEYVQDMYFLRSGRFVAYAINGVIFSLIDNFQIIWIFPVLFWMFGVSLSVYGLLKILNQPFTLISINVVILFYNVFILTNIDFPVFFWLCALSYYLLAPVLLVLVALIISKKTTVQNILFISLASIFLGGGHEAFTPIAMVGVGLIIVKEWVVADFNFKNLLLSDIVRKSLLSLVLMSVVLIVVIIAPGNYSRLNIDEFVSPQSVYGYVKGFAVAISTFFYFFAFYIPYYFIVALIVYRFLDSTRIIKLFKEKSYMLIISFVYFSYLILSVFPSVYLWGGFGIQRNYTHVVFVTMIFTVYLFLCLFFYFQSFTDKNLKKLAVPLLACLALIMSFNIYYDSSSAKIYADAVDNRVELALTKQEMGDYSNLEVTKLPIPYTNDVKYLLFKWIGKKNNPKSLLYYTSETDIVPNEYAYHFRKYYNLDFDIVLKDD